MISVQIKGGTKKAKRFAKRLGAVRGCSLLRGDSKPTYSAYGIPKRIGGRISVCKLACDHQAHRRVRREFMKNDSPVLWFHDKCAIK